MTLSNKKMGLSFLLLLIVLIALPTGVTAQGEAAAQVGFFETYEIMPDGRIEVPVTVRGVSDLYAVDIQIEFDPALLEVEDANPNLPGVQPALGTFLDAGLTLFNEVDNEAGLVNFVMTQVNPSEGKSGDGVLLVLYFRALTEGTSDLTVVKVDLADRTGAGVTSKGVDGSILISGEVEARPATPIPVQDPTGLVPIPTLAPTPTITPTAIPTATEAPTIAPTATLDPADAAKEPDQVAGEKDTVVEEEKGFSLINYWWAVLIVLLLTLGIGVYLRRTKRL